MKANYNLTFVLMLVLAISMTSCRSGRSGKSGSEESVFSKIAKRTRTERSSGSETSGVGTSSGPVTTTKTRAGHLPPGQAKKVYGHQSAKAFAPGQQKKKGTTVSSKQKKQKGKSK